MEIKQIRRQKGANSTISELYINGEHSGLYILEDIDRGLSSDMALSEIKSVKVYGETAIPTGRYRVRITQSPKFKRKLPLLYEVPGYSGIRMHAGNTIKDSLGCLLPGTGYQYASGEYRITGGTSRPAEKKLIALMEGAIEKGEKVWWEIARGYDDPISTIQAPLKQTETKA